MNREAKQLFEMIQKWIRQRHTTQTALAKALGIKQPSLSGMLSGKIKLPKKRLQEIIKILNPDENDIALARILYFDAEQEDNTINKNPDENVSNKLNIDLSDQNTIRLLEYWRDLSDSKRYEILSILAQFKETGILPKNTTLSFFERNMDLHNSEVNEGERK